MLPDRVSNSGPLTYESGALPIALRGPANRDVFPTSDFLDLWYTSGILVTYVPVFNSRRGYCYPGLRPIRYFKV